MASAYGIRAGAAFIELSVNDSKLIKGLRGALARLKAFGAGLQNIGAGMQAMGVRLMAAGAGIVAPLIASAKGFAEMGDALSKMSARTGVSVENLSELAYAAQLSGASLQDVEVGIRYMQKTLAEAANGSATAAEALARLGLAAEQLMGLSPDQQFAVIGQRLAQIEDPAQRAAAAMAVFGRSGTHLLPMLGDLAALRAEARRLGLVMSKEDAKAATILNDALDRVWATLRSLVVTIGSALAPLLTDWAGRLSELVATARNWLAQNQGLVVSILKIGLAVAGAGVALTALGGIVSALGTAFGVFATVGAAALGFLLSPIGLVTAAIVGLGAYFVWASGAGGEALAWLGARFGDLQNFALESLQGIKDALAAGDVALAARVFWLALLVAWQAGINTLKGWWLDFKGWFFQKTSDLFYGAVAMIAEAWYGLKKIWLTTVNFWADVLGKFASFFQRTWNDLIGWASKQWVKAFALIDPSVDVEAVNKRIEQDTERRNVEIARTTLDARLDRAKELQDLEQDRRGTLAAIADMADQEDRDRREQYDRERKESADALKAAQEEWRLAVAEAKEKRQAAEAGRPEVSPAPELAVPEIAPLLGVVPAAIEQVREKMDVVGTFSAFADLGLGVGPSAVQERTAKASEETARNTKRIAQKLDENELVFE